MPDPLAGPYSKTIAQQRNLNARQETELGLPPRHGASNAGSRPVPPRSIGFDRMYRPSADSVADLRQEQAEFAKTEDAISRENAWMAVPALAPAAVALGLEAAGAVASRLAPAITEGPLQLVERDPYLRVGDNWATRAGRRAHAALRARVAQKPGWDPEPSVLTTDGRILKPDVRTPARVRKAGEDPKPYQFELKPDSPSGRRAAARALKKYEATDVRTRAIFYDRKPFV